MFKQQKGQGLVEYSLILALVAVASILVLTNLGAKVVTIFTDIINVMH